MKRKIKTIPKEKMKGIKAMSPFMIDELMLVGLRLFKNKEGETINNYHYDKRRN